MEEDSLKDEIARRTGTRSIRRGIRTIEREPDKGSRVCSQREEQVDLSLSFSRVQLTECNATFIRVS